MATNYVQEGKALNYTPSGADVASGDLVVIGTIAGVAKTDIADGKTGAVHSSMETVIEANKENYYLALRRTQQTIRTEKQNWEARLSFFLKTMVKQKDNLARKVKEERHLREALPALSRTILEMAGTRGEVTVREIEDASGANRNTIKAHLKKLAEQEYLVAVGKGRGARYTVKKQS